MIVVDSSVLIGVLKRQQSSAVRKYLHEIDPDEILLGDLILLEVLQGAENDDHARAIERRLRTFPLIGMLDAELAVRAAERFRQLRRLGVTIRKTVDLIIGTYCIEHGHALLHQDRDFDPMAAHLGLRVV